VLTCKYNINIYIHTYIHIHTYKNIYKYKREKTHDDDDDDDDNDDAGGADGNDTWQRRPKPLKNIIETNK